jgi:hypothetical protein
MVATEIHANIVSTLSDRAYIHTPAWLHPLPFLLFFGVCWAQRTHGSAPARLVSVGKSVFLQ